MSSRRRFIQVYRRWTMDLKASLSSSTCCLFTILSLSLSLSNVIGFARHRVASAREISARPRSDHSDSWKIYERDEKERSEGESRRCWNWRTIYMYICIGEVELLQVEFSSWPLINRDWFQIIWDNSTVCRIVRSVTVLI